MEGFLCRHHGTAIYLLHTKDQRVLVSSFFFSFPFFKSSHSSISRSRGTPTFTVELLETLRVGRKVEKNTCPSYPENINTLLYKHKSFFFTLHHTPAAAAAAAAASEATGWINAWTLRRFLRCPWCWTGRALDPFVFSRLDVRDKWLIEVAQKRKTNRREIQIVQNADHSSCQKSIWCGFTFDQSE